MQLTQCIVIDLLQLVDRLSNNDVLYTRAFNIAKSRINGSVFGGYVHPLPLCLKNILDINIIG
jgi:hypothetical protein